MCQYKNMAFCMAFLIHNGLLTCRCERQRNTGQSEAKRLWGANKL